MDIEQIIDSMTPEVYQRLATAVELGKWPDGVALTPEQKENSLQLVMLWQARYNTDAQHMTIDTSGQMVMKSKQQLKEDFGIVPKPISMAPRWWQEKMRKRASGRPPTTRLPI